MYLLNIRFTKNKKFIFIYVRRLTIYWIRRRIYMENEILQLAASQGLWAVLFVLLLLYVLKENSKREEKFQDIIANLTERLDILDVIKKDVVDMKEDLHSLNIMKNEKNL